MSRRGWALMAGGIVTAGVGYGLLSLSDPAGRNWASRISPPVILAGYAAIAGATLARPPA